MNRAVVYAGTRNIYDQLVVAAKSLIQYNDIDRIYFLIEDDRMDVELPSYIKFINVSGQTFFPESGPNFSSRWTYMTLMRLALPKMLAESRILWLDVDTIVLGSLAGLFNEDLTGYYMAAVREPERCMTPFLYYNAGVMLMNLDEMRDGMDDRLIQLVNHKRLNFPDQDAINLLCQTMIKEISPIYNACRFTQMAMDVKILHLANVRNRTQQPIYQEAEQFDWRVK